MKSLNFNKSNAQQEDVLSNAQMKNILGGHDGGGEELCMGCNTNKDCWGVNKGDCKKYDNCNGGVKCCTGWTSCED